MNRIASLCGLLMVFAGCGVAPTGESEQPLVIHVGPCVADGAFPVAMTQAVPTSTVNPWGSRTGVVVASDPADDGTFTIYGVDSSSSGADGIVWFMLHANENDLWNFESYPQSARWCGGGLGNGSAGSSPDETPDPRWNGICVPNNIYTTAQSWYLYGPPEIGNEELCPSYSTGGCVPKTCSQLTGCGDLPDGCFKSYVYCACRCACGEVNGRCLICLPPR